MISSPTNYTAGPFWPLILIWPPFELVHYLWPRSFSHNTLIPSHYPFKKFVDFIPFGQGFAYWNSIQNVFLVLILLAPKHRSSFWIQLLSKWFTTVLSWIFRFWAMLRLLTWRSTSITSVIVSIFSTTFLVVRGAQSPLISKCLNGIDETKIARN